MAGKPPGSEAGPATRQDQPATRSLTRLDREPSRQLRIRVGHAAKTEIQRRRTAREEVLHGIRQRIAIAWSQVSDEVQMTHVGRERRELRIDRQDGILAPQVSGDIAELRQTKPCSL